MSLPKIYLSLFFLLVLGLGIVIGEYCFLTSTWTVQAFQLFFAWYLLAFITAYLVLRYCSNPKVLLHRPGKQAFVLTRREPEVNVGDANESKSTGKWDQAHILNNMQNSIAVLDTEGNVLFLNRLAQGLLNSLTTGAHNVNILQDLLSIDDFADIMNAVMNGQSWQGEAALQVDGYLRHFMHRVDPLKDNNNIIGLVIISTDISELAASREQAQAANLARNQFLANMSHEIRTPLIGILGAVDLLEESRLNNTQNANVRIIRDCSEQLLNIINDILDTSKIELDLMELHPNPCNLLDLFNRLINNIEPLLKEKGLKIKLDISSDIPAMVQIDENKLKQILVNIIYNAIKFTNRGYISFSAAMEKEDNITWLSLSISDTGIGIPDYEVANIFKPFTQVDNSNSRQYGGAGLGLYLCKKLVELMHGEIYLNSQAGLGTTFFIKLPIEIIAPHEVKDTSMQCNDNLYVDNLLLDFNPVQVLLVEDNDLNRKIVLQMLVNYGFEAAAANNGLDGLRLLQEKHFDVILMDMQMPVMDGYEATRMIRQYEELKNIPIIAMTAHAMAGDREKCLANGCTSYIAKPFKAEELAREIRQHINSHTSASKKHDLELNSFINDLLPEFMEQLEEMMANLQLAVNDRDLAAIKSISHDIKGTAGMYGFSEISNIGSQIEQAAKEYSFTEIEHKLGGLLEVYKQVNVKVG